MPKYSNLEEFYHSLPEDQELATRRFVEHISTNFENLELVLAWNQPMFKSGKNYIVGFMPTKKHINLLTISDDAVTEFKAELSSYRHGSRSIALPFDWQIDAELIKKIIEFQVSHSPSW